MKRLSREILLVSAMVDVLSGLCHGAIVQYTSRAEWIAALQAAAPLGYEVSITVEDLENTPKGKISPGSTVDTGKLTIYAQSGYTGNIFIDGPAAPSNSICIACSGTNGKWTEHWVTPSNAVKVVGIALDWANVAANYYSIEVYHDGGSVSWVFPGLNYPGFTIGFSGWLDDTGAATISKYRIRCNNANFQANNTDNISFAIFTIRPSRGSLIIVK